MKTLILALTVLLGSSAYATSTGLTQSYIVVQDFNDDIESTFQLMSVPISGCYGLQQGPQLTQLTAPYEIDDSIGCGIVDKVKVNINALTCGEVVESEEYETSGIFKKIVLDISKCEHKNDKRFVTLIRTAAARNFPQHPDSRQKEVQLIIRK